MNAGTILRRARGSAAERLGLNSRARARLDGSRAALLYYHRVIPESVVARDHVEPGMYVTPESFEAQLDWLTEHFRVLPLAEIVDRLATGRALPPAACAITFDDGWRDNHDHALDALARRGLPATIFVVTGRVGSEGAFWPDEVCRRIEALGRAEQQQIAESHGAAGGGSAVDRVLTRFKTLDSLNLERALERLRACTPEPPDRGRELMDWDELERVAAAGIDVESHGLTHALLTALPDEAAALELRASMQALHERGHGRNGLLAYPSGAHDASVRRAAHEAGYRAAVTIETGLACGAHDAFALPRLCIHQGIAGSRGEFLAKVPGRA